MKFSFLVFFVLLSQTTLTAQTSDNKNQSATIYDSLAIDICECTNQAIFNKMSETGRAIFAKPDMTSESLKKDIEEAIKSDPTKAEAIEKDIALLQQSESEIGNCMMARMLKYGDIDEKMGDDSEDKIMDSMKKIPACKAVVQLSLLSSGL
ncbi:MAG: hypothetical protein ACKO5C_06865 [Ferruginibacter sp.]